MNSRTPSQCALEDEDLRVERIDRSDVATPVDPDLGDLVRLAAELCATPFAAIMLLDGSRMVFKATSGLHIAVQLRDGRSPCERTLTQIAVYEVADALIDSDYSGNGIPLGGREFRFYAGAPLITQEGSVVGTIFVLGVNPRTLNASQKDALVVLGRQVSRQMELSGRVREMELASRTHKRTDVALAVERNFVSAVLDTVGSLVVVLDTAGRIVRFNRACENVSGYTSVELLGHYFWDELIPCDEVSAAVRQFERLRSGKPQAAFENAWLTQEGGRRQISWTATTLRDSQEQVAFIIATGIDVTGQREAEATLRANEERYRELVEGSLGLVCTHDADGVLLSVNGQITSAIGRSVEEVVGKSVLDFMFPGGEHLFAEYLKRIRRDGQAEGLLHLQHLCGEMRIISYRNKLITVAGGDSYVLGFGLEVTDKMRTERELRSLVRQSNSVLESVGDGIYGLDLEGRVTVVNPAAAQMLGYTPEEMLGRSMHELVHHSHANGVPYGWKSSPVFRSLNGLETSRVTDEVFWRKDGTSFPVDYVARPQIDTDEGGRAVGVVVAFTDTTHHRALDRMKDEFIATVSHELRTPLTSLRASLGLLQSGALAAKPERARQMLDIALGNTDRLVRLVNDILDLERMDSGRTGLNYKMFGIDDLLRQTAATQQKDAAKAEIEFAVEAQQVDAWADPERVTQTLNNLISNALKFSPRGSRVVFKATRTDRGEIQIEVQDSGPGIPEDKLEQIFERFHQVDASDARKRGGTGLGLAICRSIVEQHGGRIWAMSKPDEGASFFFTLPSRPLGGADTLAP